MLICAFLVRLGNFLDAYALLLRSQNFPVYFFPLSSLEIPSYNSMYVHNDRRAKLTIPAN